MILSPIFFVFTILTFVFMMALVSRASNSYLIEEKVGYFIMAFLVLLLYLALFTAYSMAVSFGIL